MVNCSTLKRNPLYLVEWLTFGGGVICFVLYQWFSLSDRGFFPFYLNTIKTAAYLYPLGLLLCHLLLTIKLGLKWRRSGSVGAPPKIWDEFRYRFLRLKVLLRDLRYLHALSLCLIVSIHLKHLIPFINKQILDELFLLAERELFDGKVALEALLPYISASWAPILSLGYQGYYPYLSLLVFVLVLQRNNSLRREFSSAFVLTWFFGMAWVYALPTWGPCFFVPEVYQVLPETKMLSMQHDLWSMKLSLDQNPKQPGILYAISGFPSLHFAIALLGTWYLFQVHFIFGVFSLGFTLLTSITTVYFGWHYLVDNIGSLALVAFALYCAKKMELWQSK